MNSCSNLLFAREVIIAVWTDIGVVRQIPWVSGDLVCVCVYMGLTALFECVV